MSDSVCVGDEMRCVDPAVRVLCWCGMSPSVQIQNACGLAQVWGGRRAEEMGSTVYPKGCTSAGCVPL